MDRALLRQGLDDIAQAIQRYQDHFERVKDNTNILTTKSGLILAAAVGVFRGSTA